MQEDESTSQGDIPCMEVDQDDEDLVEKIHLLSGSFPLSKEGWTGVFGTSNVFFGNLLMLHDLVDQKGLSEIEQLCKNQSSSRQDWKVLAQKVSLRVGRRHYIKKSDAKQLIIVCLSQYIFLIGFSFHHFSYRS